MQLPAFPTGVPLYDTSQATVDVVNATIPTDSYIVGQGMFTTYREDCDEGYVDTEHRVSYNRIEDGVPNHKIRFQECRTITVKRFACRTVDASDLPTFACGLKNPPPRSTLEGGADHGTFPSVVSTPVSSAPPTPIRFAPGTPINATQREHHTTCSSIASTPTNAAKRASSSLPSSIQSSPTTLGQYVAPDLGLASADHTDESSDSDGGSVCSESLTPFFGPPTHAAWCHHRFVENFFERRAAQQANGVTSPVRGVSTGNSTQAISPALSTSSIESFKARGMTPSSIGEYISRETTPLSQIDLSKYFTPNTVQVMRDIDAMASDELPRLISPFTPGPSSSDTPSTPCMSGPSGLALPSTPRTVASSPFLPGPSSSVTPSTPRMSGSSGLVLPSTPRTVTPKRHVIEVIDSDSDDSDDVEVVQFLAKKRKL